MFKVANKCSFFCKETLISQEYGYKCVIHIHSFVAVFSQFDFQDIDNSEKKS